MIFFDIKNQVHDANGVDDPNLWNWTMLNGVYYPTYKLEKDYVHRLIRNWMNINKLPKVSLEEIPANLFYDEMLDKRNFFMYLLDNI